MPGPHPRGKPSSEALRLDYYALKRRVSERVPASDFVEVKLAPAEDPTRGCTAELVRPAAIPSFAPMLNPSGLCFLSKRSQSGHPGDWRATTQRSKNH